MRIPLLTVAATMLFTAAASAQPRTPAPPSAGGEETGYVEGVAQSSFGHVTSQSYGIEAGYVIGPQAEVLLELGRVSDASTQAIQDSADTIAGSLAATGVSVTVREPVSFLAVGGKYVVATHGAFHPYVLAGVGVARVKHDVVFRVAGADVTSNIGQFGVALGGDLSGTETKFAIVAGAGGMIPIGRRFLLDLQFRVNRVMSDPAISFARAGIGFGIRF